MKKIIDQNGRLFGKISVVDVLAVLVVIVLAFALNVKNNELEATRNNGGDTPITITMKAENLPLYVVDAIQAGDKVYDKERPSGGPIGEITKVEEQPGSRVEKLSNGTFMLLPNEDSRNLLITVEGTGLVSEGRYAINRIYDIGVNASRTFYSNYAQFVAKVIEIG